MSRGRRRLIALWVLLAVVVVGGMAAVWFSRQDSSPGATVAVGFSPQGVLVDGRSRHVLTLDDIGVDRQGRYLQTGAVSMLDAATGAVLRSVPVGRNPTWMARDERTRRAFVVVLGLGGANSLLVRTLDTQTGAVLRTVTLLTSTTTSGSVRLGPGAVAVDERAGHVFVANRVSYPPAPVAPLLWMLDARNGRLLRTLRLPAPPFAIAIDQRTRHAFVTSAARAVMWMLDAESGTLLRPIPLSAGATTVAVDQRTDQVIAATSGATGRITLFDARTGQPRRTIAAGAYPSMMLVDERRDHAFLLDQGALPGNAPGSVRTIDLRHGRLLRTVTVGVTPVAMALHERSGRVFIVNQETATRRGTVSVLAASTGRLLTTIPVGVQPSALAVDESTGHVFVTSQSATVPRTDALSAVIARVRQIMAVNRGDNRGIVTILNAGV